MGKIAPHNQSPEGATECNVSYQLAKRKNKQVACPTRKEIKK